MVSTAKFTARLLAREVLLTACSACSETYQYYTLPFCQPAVKTYKVEALGEVLAGDRTVSSLYNLTFVQDQTMVKLCDRKLTSKDLKLFRNAVKNDYYFQVRLPFMPAAPGRTRAVSKRATLAVCHTTQLPLGRLCSTP